MPEKGRMKRSYTLSRAIVARLEKYCEDKGMKREAVVERALALYLTEESFTTTPKK